MTKSGYRTQDVIRTIVIHPLCAMLGVLLSIDVAFGADDSTNRAKKTAEEFVQALKAEDLEAITKLANAPFLMQYKSLRTMEEFRKAFAEFFEDKELGKIEWKTITAGKLDEIKDKLDEKDHYAKLKGILLESDRVVLIEVKFGKMLEKRDLMAFAVAVKSEKAHVIGFVD